MSQPQKRKFIVNREQRSKMKKITILHFIANFQSFPLRLRTSGATRVLKPNRTCLIRWK